MIRKRVYALFTLALLLSACAPEFDGGKLTQEQVNQDGFGYYIYWHHNIKEFLRWVAQ